MANFPEFEGPIKYIDLPPVPVVEIDGEKYRIAKNRQIHLFDSYSTNLDNYFKKYFESFAKNFGKELPDVQVWNLTNAHTG